MFLITYSIGSTDNQRETIEYCAEHMANWIVTMFEEHGMGLVVHSIHQL